MANKDSHIPNNLIYKSFIFIISLLLIPNFIFSQGETDNWIFGTVDNYVVFTDSGPVGYNPPINSPWTIDFFLSQRAATLSDQDGNLIMYTNGEELWDNEFNEISSLSFAVSGDQFAPSLFIPAPNSENDYLLILTKNIYSSYLKFIKLRYDPINNNILQLNSQTVTLYGIAKISATYHANGKDIWVLTHHYGSSDFWSYLITDQGGYSAISSPIISTIGSIQEDSIPTNLFSRVTYGIIQFSPGGNYVAMSSVGLNLIEIFDFDNETGIVSNLREIPIQRPYSIEFSSNGTLLYFSQLVACHYSGCNLPSLGSLPVSQVDILAGSNTSIINSMYSASSTSLLSPAYIGNLIQLASNRKIYCNVDGGANNLAVINEPNNPGVNCNWADTGVYFPPSYFGSTFQDLPEFFTSYLDFNINLEDGCFGDTSLIYTLTNQGFDSIRWEFTDPVLGLISIPNQDTIIHYFNEPGAYDISLKRYRNGNLDEIKKRQYIYPNVNIDLPEDTIMCEGLDLFLTVAQDYCDFGWVNHFAPDPVFYYPTDTFFTDTCIIEQGQYWWPILLNHDDICGSMDSTFVIIQPNPINLGNDTSGLCSLDSFSIDAQISGATSYLWSTQDTISSIYVGGSGIYSVTVNYDGCPFPDSIEVNFFDPVDIVLPEDTIICLGNMITLSVSSVNYNLGWANLTDSTMIWVSTFGTDMPGLWTPFPMNYPQYCGNLDSILITVQADSLELGNDTIGACLSTPLVIDATLSGLTTYQWSTSEITPSIIALQSDTFYVTVTQNYCEYFDEIVVSYDEPLIFDLPDTSIVCDSIPIELSVIDILADYLWSPTGETTPEIMVTNPGLYSVTASNGCGDFVDSTIVLSLPSPVVNLGNDTIICSLDSILLDASDWSLSTVEVWSTGSTDSAIWVSSSDQYFVTVTNDCGNAYDSILIETESPVILNLGNDTIICFGEELLISPEIIGEGTLQWSTGESTPEIVVADEGEYFLSITNVCGEFTDTLNLAIQINDFAFDLDTIFISGGDSAILSGPDSTVSGVEVYEWSTGENTQNITVSNTGTFWLTFIDSIGCEATDSIIVSWYVTIAPISYLDNIKIFPNPTSNELIIEGLKDNDEIRIFDVLGKEQSHDKLSNMPYILNLKNYHNGIYLLRIKRNNEVRVFKVMKQ